MPPLKQTLPSLLSSISGLACEISIMCEGKRVRQELEVLNKVPDKFSNMLPLSLGIT